MRGRRWMRPGPGRRGRGTPATTPLTVSERLFDTEGMRSEGALARLQEVASRARPVALARERVLPVTEPLQALLPNGLRRGTTVGVGGRGATSFSLALLAGPMAAGSWAAVVGPDGPDQLGLAAAAELGVPLERLVLVTPGPGDDARALATAAAALVDAFDVVLVRPRRRVGASDARRLAARSRERGSVMVVLGGEQVWPEAPDVRLEVTAAAWEGLGAGHGHLRARRATVEATGRRDAARTRRALLWLPAAGGGVAAAGPAPAAARPLGRRREAS